MNKLANKQSSIIEIVNFIKKNGTSFRVVDGDAIEVTMKSGRTKTFYIDESGEIYATSETISEEENEDYEIL